MAIYLDKKRGDASSKAKVSTKIRNIVARKTGKEANHNTSVAFNFNATIEEIDRSNDGAILSFQLLMKSEPSVADFTVEGKTAMMGDRSEIEKMLAPDPETTIPLVFTSICQQIFPTIFMLAGTIDVPCPSLALLKKAQVRVAYPTRA